MFLQAVICFIVIAQTKVAPSPAWPMHIRDLALNITFIQSYMTASH